MNPKQMKAMMKRMGISQEEIADVEEIVIKTRTKELVFSNAAVTAMTVQGQKTYQIVGEAKERPRKREEREEGGVPDEDVQLVISQTGCSASEARKALEECDGAPAEAILKIMASK
jgi:nascent polypeptide-associated complex subunit alpha